MIKHSPDHAEQGADVEGAIRIALWNACKARGMSQDGSIQLVAQTLADPALAAALRGRDAVVEAEDIAAIDAILHRWRLNDDTARPSVKLGLLRRLRAALHDAAHLQQNGEGVGNG